MVTKKVSVPVARRRQRLESPNKVDHDAYKIHFGCEYKGRYFRSSKRKVRWIFGFADQEAVRDGKTGANCRGEEHDITLVWSVKSGKTRIFWNKSDISNLFRDIQGKESLDITWQTRAGDLLKIEARASPPAGVQRQYDLKVNGCSYFDLPLLRDIRSRTQDRHPDDVSATSSLTMSQVGSHIGSVVLNASDDQPPEARDYRLSMVGLNHSDRDVCPLTDELHSEVFSSALDSVRFHVVRCLPQLEAMVSRAIMDAFICEKDELSSSTSSASSDFDGDLPQFELLALWEAFEWSKSNLQEGTCDEEVTAKALELMQKHVTETFMRIRNEEMPAHVATRLLLNVAALLGLNFASPITRDTVIFCGLPKGTVTREFRRVLHTYGYVESAAVLASSSSGFGFCRFIDEKSCKLVCKSINEGSMLIHDVAPKAFLVAEDSSRHFWSNLSETPVRVEAREDSSAAPRTDPISITASDRTISDSSDDQKTDAQSSLSPTSVMNNVFAAPALPDKMFANLVVDDRSDYREHLSLSFESIRA